MGLIKTAVKTAVAVKTAHVVHDRIQRRKQAEWVAAGHSPETFPGVTPPVTAATGQAAASWSDPRAGEAAGSPSAPSWTPALPPEPATGSAARAAGGAPMTEVLAQLRELADLKAAGVLTDAEFDAQKQRILATQ